MRRRALAWLAERARDWAVGEATAAALGPVITPQRQTYICRMYDLIDCLTVKIDEWRGP